MADAEKRRGLWPDRRGATGFVSAIVASAISLLVAQMFHRMGEQMNGIFSLF